MVAGNVWTVVIALIGSLVFSGSTQDPPPRGRTDLGVVEGVSFELPSGWSSWQPPKVGSSFLADLVEDPEIHYVLSPPGETGATLRVGFLPTGDESLEAHAERLAQKIRGDARIEDAGHAFANVMRISARGRYAELRGPVASFGLDIIEDARLLGAVVSTPTGQVVFKLLGSAAEVGALEEAFDALVEGIRL